MRLALFALALLLAGGEAAPAQTKADAAVTSLTIFAGTSSGLWRSPDWGTNWERVLGRGAGASLEKVGPVRCIAPLGPQVYVVADSGVFISFDFGETWRRIADGAQCNAFLTSRYPQADPTLFLATSSGLLRSRADLLLGPEDAPRSFEPAPLSAGAVFRLEWPGPALIAATATGVFISADSGDAFVPASEGLPKGEVRALAASGYFAVDPTMFVGVGAQGVFRSPDGGRHWLAAGLAGRTVNDLVWIGPILYAATDAGPFRSDDLGKTWSPLNQGLSGSALRLLFPLLPDSSAEAFLATSRGVFWTGDGGLNWRATGDLLQKEEILALATFPAVDQAPLRKRKK